MSEDTMLEVVRALAYGVDTGDIANMAEVDVAEIEKIREDHAGEVKMRQGMITGGICDGD